MSTARQTAAAAVSALAVLAIAAGSRLPWTASPADRALLRLSWRAPGESAEHCRPLSEEEKADLPVHMRVPEVCETRILPYLLEVRIDGAATTADTLHGAGAREDRPVVVFREIPLPAGPHDVEVRFRPLRQPDATGVEREEDEDNALENLEAHDPEDSEEERDSEDLEGWDEEQDEEQDEREEGRAIAIEYAERLTLAPRTVALLTLDPQRRRLVRVTAPSR